ncbi:MAG: serine/threonine-protein kinase, partial [Polyangiaceae bacterium]
MGSYEPLIDLASGGMGTVAIARRVGAAGFERLVVTKRVHPRLLAQASYRRMIRDEALLLARVHDAHVVPILDVVDADGELMLVLEYVESMSLAELLASAKVRGERVPLPVIARIVVDALAGLHAAHDCLDEHGGPLGIIHRDVSPQNVIVGTDGVSRLVDFGIAKATAPTDESAETTTGDVIKGKVRYLSPEQIKQTPLDRRSDVFSAGVMLYEAATGRRLIAAADEGDVLLGTLLGDFDPPSKHDPAIPEALDAVLLHALAVDREERFATAAELGEAIEEAIAIASAREVARLVDVYGGEALAKRRLRLRAFGRTTLRPPRARSNRERIALLAALFTALAVALFFAFRPKAPPSVLLAKAPLLTAASPVVSALPSPEAKSNPSSPTPVMTPPKHHASTHVGAHASKKCDPPYDVLPDGTHRFKPQCV